MVRRTKEEALATRNRLLDSAELLFQKQGVSRTSLNDIAVHAGATRGAIYWHFDDKADLYNAMMDRAILPFEEAEAKALEGGDSDPISIIRKSMAHALKLVATDVKTRRVFEVATQKVEYVDEMRAVQERHISCRDECIVDVRDRLRTAAKLRGVSLPIPAIAAAHGLHAMIDGLIQNWLLDPKSFDLVAVGKRTLEVYLTGLGLTETVGEKVTAEAA